MKKTCGNCKYGVPVGRYERAELLEIDYTKKEIDAMLYCDAPIPQYVYSENDVNATDDATDCETWNNK